MGSRCVSSVAMAVAVLLAVAVMSPGATAQPACAQKLVPCGAYLGTTTTPPDTCCGQIKDAVKNELACLCSLLTNDALLQAVKLNRTQALELPRRCGISSDTSVCNAFSTNTTTGAGAPSAPPATPGNTAAVARVGASSLVVLLAFWWSLVA